MHIALFEPDIPQNTGSIIRLCACMDTVLHIIEPCGFPFDDRKIRRVALDYFDAAHIVRHISWHHFLDWKKTVDGRLLLLSAHAATPYTKFAFAPNDILLLGRESSGVPGHVRDTADARLKIPMREGLRSLNVALAASMVLGEAIRQVGCGDVE
jgi:tRNA (cytidine/uridine-2'-O-)-methyltransferase